MPNRWEARLVGNSAWRKAIWLFLFPRTAHPAAPTKELRPIDHWVVANFITQMTFNVAIWFLISPAALGYLCIASSGSAIGGPPLGARWIQEHYASFPGQETNDYYGWLNRSS